MNTTFFPQVRLLSRYPSGSASYVVRLVVGVMLTWPCYLPDVLAAQPTVEQHVKVFGKTGSFGGWPANHGIWAWPNEILVGFSVGTHKALGNSRHNIDRQLPEYHVLARSRDGGEHWSIERPNRSGMLINRGGMRHGTTDPLHVEAPPRQLTEPINFAHSDFCMTLRFQDVNGGQSRLYFSYDRGKNWEGPMAFPMLGQKGVMARTDYVVNGPRDCVVLVTVSKSNGREGRVLAARTLDGGVRWRRLGFVGPEPVGFSIMSSTVRIGPTQLITTTRRRAGENETRRRWIDAWRSDDLGDSWLPLSTVVADVGEGNPPSLVRLQDGRLCATYGVRKPPYEIAAVLSGDEGRTWSEPFVLLSEGGGRDLGYPRTIQRADGALVTVYYFQPKESPYREIRATIWRPGSRE